MVIYYSCLYFRNVMVKIAVSVNISSDLDLEMQLYYSLVNSCPKELPQYPGITFSFETHLLRDYSDEILCLLAVIIVFKILTRTINYSGINSLLEQIVIKLSQRCRCTVIIFLNLIQDLYALQNVFRNSTNVSLLSISHF